MLFVIASPCGLWSLYLSISVSNRSKMPFIYAPRGMSNSNATKLRPMPMPIPMPCKYNVAHSPPIDLNPTPGHMHIYKPAAMQYPNSMSSFIIIYSPGYCFILF